jgi:type IV pilus assembly protein PilP
MPQRSQYFPSSPLRVVHKTRMTLSSVFKNTAHGLSIAILATGLVACTADDTADLREYISEVKAQQRGPIPPLPKPEVFDTFAYDDTLLRDPFLPTAIDNVSESRNSESQSLLQPDTKREKDVLEQFALGSLKMVGSLEKDGKRWALIRASDGTVHRTTTGRYIGQDNGKIIQITENQIDLREIVPDGLGGWIERRSTLTVSE